MKRTGLLMMLFLIGTIGAFAQIREIPKAVEATFSNQYKDATNIDYQDQLVRVDVHFDLEGDRMTASYTNKGIWKETQKEWTFDKLTSMVKDGFIKSKYADREVEETIVLYLPGGSEQYRLKVRKSGVEKKYLFFNSEGRLIRESLTI